MIGVGFLRRQSKNAEVAALGLGLIASLLGRQALMQQPFQPRLPMLLKNKRPGP